MSDLSDPHESLSLTVVKESAKNYRSFIRKKKNPQNRSFISSLRKIFTEELEPDRQHPHASATMGFN
jgi:type III secretory pathway component EscR